MEATSSNTSPVPVNIEEVHQLARAKLPKLAYDYYSSGSDDQITLKKTRHAFNSIQLLPRTMVDVSKIDMSVHLFGSRADFPIFVAATAMHRMAHPEGEIATTRAAGAMGTVMTMSSLSTSTVDDVANASSGPKWFQLYVLKDRSLTERIVRKAEGSGFQALCLTVDTPFLGRRENDIRNGFHLPPGLFLEMYREMVDADLRSGLNDYVAQMLDSSLSWKDVAWLKSITSLPLLVKGILSPLDTELAIQYGVDGIIVSNHGARQLDTVPPTIEALPGVVAAARGRVPVLIDGGISRGTDVLKAIALGAKAVFIGRPILWGLAYNGEEGVKKVLSLLKDELCLAMRLSGCTTLESITHHIIFNSDHHLLAKL